MDYEMVDLIDSLRRIAKSLEDLESILSETNTKIDIQGGELSYQIRQLRERYLD